MATNRFAGITEYFTPLTERIGSDVKCMLIVPNNLGRDLAALRERFKRIDATPAAFMPRGYHEREYDTTVAYANDVILPKLKEANQAGQVFVFSVSASQYIQPYDINEFIIDGVLLETRAGTQRKIVYNNICSENETTDEVVGCRRLMNEWGWRHKVIDTPNGPTIGIIPGKDSGITVVKVSQDGIDQWEQLITQNELPITFTYLTPDGTYYYFYQFHVKGYVGIARLPGIEYLDLLDVVPAPCNEDYEVIEGLEGDFPTLAPMPEWLYNTFKLAANQQVYGKLTIIQLRKNLQTRGLPTTGSKEEMIARLADDDEADIRRREL